MDANELADELDDIDAYEKHQTLLGKASETLRQQQAEIEELKTCLIVEQEHNERIEAILKKAQEKYV
jgi:hypothetical protein